MSTMGSYVPRLLTPTTSEVHDEDDKSTQAGDVVKNEHNVIDLEEPVVKKKNKQEIIELKEPVVKAQTKTEVPPLPIFVKEDHLAIIK